MRAEERLLIVNADDFGLSPGVNRGIIDAHEHGILTSASLMVRQPGAAVAAATAREHPRLSLGLHVDLGEWVFRDGNWGPVYEVVALDDRAAVEDEVARQFAAFRRLTSRNPTHIDSHQHVHHTEPLRSVLMAQAHALEVPLRHYSPQVRFQGDFYGQTGKGEPYPEGISVEALLRILTALPPGITELGCHPGEGDDFASVYRHERAVEVAALCDPQVRAAIVAMGITLRSFGEIAP